MVLINHLGNELTGYANASEYRCRVSSTITIHHGAPSSLRRLQRHSWISPLGLHSSITGFTLFCLSFSCLGLIKFLKS